MYYWRSIKSEKDLKAGGQNPGAGFDPNNTGGAGCNNGNCGGDCNNKGNGGDNVTDVDYEEVK